MTEKLKQALSALIDGEANEIEVHRLLREFGSDESLKGSWTTYEQIRAVIRGDDRLSSEQHQILHSRISDALSMESLPEYSGLPSRSPIQSSYMKPVVGLAAAACLAVAAWLGLQTLQTPADDVPEMAGNGPVPAQTAENDANLAAAADEPAGRELELKELDAERQRQLRAYLNQHDRMARMNPNARMVIFENSPGN